jgi:hypothetical protein
MEKQNSKKTKQNKNQEEPQNSSARNKEVEISAQRLQTQMNLYCVPQGKNESVYVQFSRMQKPNFFLKVKFTKMLKGQYGNFLIFEPLSQAEQVFN